MKDTLLKELIQYGEILEDYNYYDNTQGALRVTKYYNTTDRCYYTSVMCNGECISIGLDITAGLN